MMKYLSAILLVIIFGLLIWQRFDVPPISTVTIDEIQGESSYNASDRIARGEIIETSNEYLRISIGDDVVLGLGKNTHIEFEDLTPEAPVIRLLKGRMYIATESTPVWITTNTSENVIEGGSATLVNFDFLEKVHIIPIEGSIQTNLKNLNEYLLLSLPVELTEGYDPSYEAITVDLEASDGADFYSWLGLFDE